VIFLGCGRCKKANEYAKNGNIGVLVVILCHFGINTGPLTKFEGGLNLLHEADDDAVIWLESTATAALAK